MKVFIKCLAHYHPEGVIRNSDFEDHSSEIPVGWIAEKTGIRERRFVDLSDRPSADLALKSLDKLKSQSAFDVTKIGFIISAASVDDSHVPNPGNLAAIALGIDVPVFQLKAACTSVAYAIYNARAILMADDSIDEILIVNGEPLTTVLDYNDRSTSVLFGDGGTSLIISRESGKFEVLGIDVGGVASAIVSINKISTTPHISGSNFSAKTRNNPLAAQNWELKIGRW